MIVFINEPGLQQHNIPLEANSYASIAKHDTGVNTWYALWVDGVPFDLVQVAHTYGRSEHQAAMERVEAAVKAAIKEQRKRGR